MMEAPRRSYYDAAQVASSTLARMIFFQQHITPPLVC